MAKHDQGITREGRGEEQPKDKERAQNATKIQLGHIPKQPVNNPEEQRR